MSGVKSGLVASFCPGRIVLGLMLCLFQTGCQQLPHPVRVRESGQLGAGGIHLAMIPLVVGGRAVRDPGGKIAQAAAGNLSLALQREFERCPRLFLVPREAVSSAYSSLLAGARRVPDKEITALGTRLGVEAVVVGELMVYDQRLGGDWGARRPAAVTFLVRLLQVRDGAVLWEAEFSEQQKPLSQDLWNIRRFFRRGARFLSAGELAAAGAEAVGERLCQHTAGN